MNMFARCGSDVNLHEVYNYYFASELANEMKDNETVTIYHDNGDITKVFVASKEEYLIAATKVLHKAILEDRVSYEDMLEFILSTIQVLSYVNDTFKFEF